SAEAECENPETGSDPPSYKPLSNGPEKKQGPSNSQQETRHVNEAEAERRMLEAVQGLMLGFAFGEAIPDVPFGDESPEPSIPKTGEFSVTDWSGYPEGVPRPSGTVRLIEGEEYLTNRQAANSANAAIRRQEGLVGDSSVQVHERKPVKFSGSPTD